MQRVLLKGALRIALVVIGCLLLGAAIAGCDVPFVGASPGPGQGDTHTFDLPLGGRPSLSISDPVGAIHVRPGATASATATKICQQNPEDAKNIQVSYGEQGAHFTITVQFPQRRNPYDNCRVDINATMPVASDLDIDNDVGDIVVTGLHGKMQLSSDVGRIEATQVALEADSTLNSNTGALDFSGSVGRSGRYAFQTEAGSIDVALPVNEAFHVEATADVGTIDSEFGSVFVQRGIVGAAASGDVGDAPQADVVLTTTTGTIHLVRL